MLNYFISAESRYSTVKRRGEALFAFFLVMSLPFCFSINGAFAQKRIAPALIPSPQKTVWLDVSDAKFKKDVKNYSGALDNILKLRTVTYNMKTEEYPIMGFSSGLQIGFIAQEVKEVFPTLVEKGVHPGAKKEDAAVEYMGMNYICLVPVLVNAIQEQQQQIELLKK